jgi:hypothetical protein
VRTEEETRNGANVIRAGDDSRPVAPVASYLRPLHGSETHTSREPYASASVPAGGVGTDAVVPT